MPALLRKRDEKKLEILKSIYAQHLEPEWKDTSPKIQLQYVTEVLGVSAADIAHEEAVDFVIKTIDNRQWIHAMEVYASTDDDEYYVASARDLLGRKPTADKEAVLPAQPGRLVLVNFR
jgi:hypothetical protein